MLRDVRSKRLLALAVTIVLAFLIVFQRAGKGVPDSAAVVAQVRQLNQLSTVRYTVQKVITVEEQKMPVGSERLLLVLQATVDSGVDLASLQPRDVTRRADGALVIRMPAPQILRATVDEKETKVWDRQRTWWTPWIGYSTDLEKKARLEGLDAAKKAAIDMGILKQAETNAETSIRSLLRLAGIDNVVVIRGGLS